jgi:hypothetical protein
MERKEKLEWPVANAILWREATQDALALLCASLCFSFASFALNALASPVAPVSPLSGKLAID